MAKELYQVIEDIVTAETNKRGLGKAVRRLAEIAAKLDKPVVTGINPVIRLDINGDQHLVSSPMDPDFVGFEAHLSDCQPKQEEGI